MDMRWSLDELYSSFDSKEFNNDFNQLKNYIEKLEKFTKEDINSSISTIKKIELYLLYSIEIKKLTSKLMGFTFLTTSIDSKNKEALEFQDKIQKMITRLTKPSVIFKKWLSSLENIDSLINKSNLLKNHSFYIKEIIQSTKYMLSDEEEILISKFTSTGSFSFEKLNKILTSNLLIDIELDGQTKSLPLTVIRNMSFDDNSEVRKKAYFAEIKGYEKIEDSCAAAINGIKGEVLTLSNLRGFDSPLDETLFNSRMSKDTLYSMMETIKESLPIFHKYYNKKAEILGYKNGLPFYELFAPIGNTKMSFTYEEAKNYVVKNFRTFSDKLADFSLKAFDNNWIDAEPRQGKRGGAFCSNIHPIGECRILVNFNGSFKTMNSLSHELGHGYHNQCLNDISILNAKYPMPLAETASIFCETIVKNAAINESNDAESLSILESTIVGYGQTIVDIYSRFLFEKELFEVRKDHSLSVDEIKNIMIKSQKEAYGSSLDENYLHPYMWINKPHYYYSKRNFYNFPYSFGLLFAKGLYAEYLKNKDSFVNKYDIFLAQTGTNTVEEIAKMLNIDVTSKSFWKQSLNIIENDINKFIMLCKKIK